jgi:hypothetical protein
MIVFLDSAWHTRGSELLSKKREEAKVLAHRTDGRPHARWQTKWLGDPIAGAPDWLSVVNELRGGGGREHSGRCISWGDQPGRSRRGDSRRRN